MRFIGLEFKESSPDNVVAKFCPDKIPEIRRVVVPLFPTFKVEAVDPTAAGDCFTGVLVKQGNINTTTNTIVVNELSSGCYILIYNFKARPRPPSTLAAHRGYHLPLLPSGPGGVHEPPLRKTQRPWYDFKINL